MTEQPKPGTEIEVGVQMPPEMVQQFAQMAMMIPSEGTDAVESIIGTILNASSWEKLGDPWESSSVDELKGVTMLITGIVRRPSDFKDGLGIFLVVTYTQVKSGEVRIWTTGSLACVAQLTRAYAAGWLPLYAQLVVAERATKSGYHPHHLKFLGTPKQADAEKAPF